MTRVLVDDPNRAPRARRDWLHDLAQVAHPRRECLRPTRPQRVRRQDVAVRLEVRAASGGIDYHLPVVPREGVDVVPGELTRAFAVPGVRVQGAATALPLTQHLARAFHDPTERHKGWARGLAGAAHQTRFEMFDGRLARRGRTFEDGADQLDASAR